MLQTGVENFPVFDIVSMLANPNQDEPPENYDKTWKTALDGLNQNLSEFEANQFKQDLAIIRDFMKSLALGAKSLLAKEERKSMSPQQIMEKVALLRSVSAASTAQGLYSFIVSCLYSCRRFQN
jgi:hypothetical protein